MPTRSLPSHPDLGQLKLQAKELQRAHRDGSVSAAARVLGHHPRLKGRPMEEVLASPLTLAGAQLVIAREYGFPSWAALKQRVAVVSRVGQFNPHAHFDEAAAALKAGDLERLRAVIAAHPQIVHARTNLDPPYGYFTGATLLHHVAGNPGWERPMPMNIVEVARLLLESGSDVHAKTLGPSGGTTMGLLITSKQASDANLSGPLIDLLLEFGAELDLNGTEVVVPDWKERNLLDLPLANHAPRAAEKLIELGAKPDVCAAAALGRMDLLCAFFDAEGRLLSCPRRHGKAMTPRDATGLALLFAYVMKQREAVDFLLEMDGNWNMTGVNNGAALHRAAWDGDLPMVRRLVAKGADMSNRDNPFNSTPLSWAQHNKQREVFDWMRSHCAIDLHEAVCFDLREHIEARLREEPSAINRRIDHWEIPQCTPLHWAAWPHYADVDGRHSHDESTRMDLVKLLLNRGAEINIIAGNGCTALDIAEAAKATNIAQLLRQNGGMRAAEL